MNQASDVNSNESRQYVKRCGKIARYSARIKDPLSNHSVFCWYRACSNQSMKKFLMVYATVERQTAKIAEAMANELIPMGIGVEISNITDVQEKFDPLKYDGVIVGGSVHLAQFSPELRKWTQANASALSKVNGAFFSVCLGILEKGNEATQNAERKIVTDFFAETGWHPSRWTIFAGALHYSKYNWFKKLILKMIAAKAGGGTDTAIDYEYTDWNEVKKFAHDSTIVSTLQ